MNDRDKKVLDLFMDDGPWTGKKPRGKKTFEQAPEEKGNIVQPDESIGKEEPAKDINISTKEKKYENQGAGEIQDSEFGEVDYAILKAVTYGFKDIKQLSKALQIRTIVIEKHIYKLGKEGAVKYFQNIVLTSRGEQAIESFEKSSPEDVWKPIDEYIVSVIKQDKEKKLKLQKMTDIALLVSMVILIILIIYFGIFS